MESNSTIFRAFILNSNIQWMFQIFSVELCWKCCLIWPNCWSNLVAQQLGNVNYFDNLLKCFFFVLENRSFSLFILPIKKIQILPLLKKDERLKSFQRPFPDVGERTENWLQAFFCRQNWRQTIFFSCRSGLLILSPGNVSLFQKSNNLSISDYINLKRFATQFASCFQTVMLKVEKSY